LPIGKKVMTWRGVRKRGDLGRERGGIAAEPKYYMQNGEEGQAKKKGKGGLVIMKQRKSVVLNQ